MKENVFMDLFTDKNSIIDNFALDKNALDDITIIVAQYDYENYNGESVVVYRDEINGRYYQVHGGHCSCYGLEGQWQPEEIGDFDMFVELSKKIGMCWDEEHYYDKPPKYSVYDVVFK